MAERFHWGLEGLNGPKFRAYTTLLHLQNGGQGDPNWSWTAGAAPEESESFSDDEDTKTAVAQGLSDFDEPRLKRAFLDRVAELVSNIRNGKHVAAAVLVETRDRYTVLVAKNNGFKEKKDGLFLKELEASLREISRTESFELSDSKLGLWDSLIDHYKPRLLEWESDLRQNLKKYETHPQSEKFTPASHGESPLYCLSQTLQQSDLTDKDRMSRLVDECHNIRRSHEDSIAGLRDGTTKVAKNLWQSIGFLGRLRSAYNDLLRAAERLPGFEELEIVSVTLGVDQSKKKPAAKPWSLAETFNSIGFSLSDSNVRKLFGQTWSKSRLLERFSSELRQPLQFHVEVQLVLYLMSAYDSTASTFNYIGCSKYSCLLCHMVVKGCGQFETRGCHGKVSSPWSIPEANGFSQNDIDRLVTLLKSMQKAIGDQICEPGRERIELRKESTVGESSIATKTDIVDEPHLQRLVSSHLHSQRQSHLAKYLEGSIDTTMVGDDESVPDLEEAPPIPSRKSGICHVCDRKTDRRCSRCQRDWFCNAHCEKEMTITHRFQCSSGALTTADYLESAVLRDEIPDDPQTLEDYGFSRCITWNQKSHLAGLYKGLLLPLKVDAKKLDRWLHEGSLVLNIIREFHRLPEGSRGSYFPWFLKNKHLLDSAEPLNESHHQQAPQVWIEEAKSYLPLEEQTRAITDMQPVARRDVFIAFAGLLQSGYPHPKWPSWYTLGFCTCRDEWEERSLGSTYNRLIGGNKIQVDYHISLGSEYSGPPQTPTCSFVEFWDAYSSGTLSELFDKYGLKQWRLRFKHLDTFLSVGYSSPRPSVWRLRHLLALDDPINIPPQLRGAVGDYGLTISMDARWKLGLLEVYRKIFSRGDPMELHAARTRGEALKYVASVVPEIDPHVALILKSLPTRY